MATTVAPSDVVDPVTFAVARHGLIAAAHKAFLAFKRTAMMPTIYDGHDFAVSLYDDRLNLIAEATAVPLFAGALGETVPRTAEVIGREHMYPGDVFVTTLPYLNGSHPADAVLIEPVFVADRLVAFVALRGHMGDLAADSYFPTDTTEVFQEGLLLPPLKLYEGGVLDQKIIDIIRANSRMPIETSGDFLAGAGAVRTASDAVRTLVSRYGYDTYHSIVDQILDHGERLARQGIEAIPDGIYTAEGALDDDGVVIGVPVPLRVTVTIAGSRMTVDTSGSAPQQAGPLNCPRTYTQAVARMALKTMATPDTPGNSGEHRTLTVITPEGTIYNPGQTAPSFCSVTPALQLGELIMAALASALPAEMPAMSGGDEAGLIGMLRNPTTGRYGVTMLVSGSGFGAKQGSDGSSALYARIASGLRLISGEVIEARYPTVRVRCELDPDSGGAGQWRGGLGMIEEQQYLSDGMANYLAERTSDAFPITGLAGGLGPKRQNGIKFYVGTDREIGPPFCKQSKLPIAPGDRHVAWTAGGGGWGDPLDRDLSALAWDLKNEYVSGAAAVDLYGAVLNDAGELDLIATEARRARLRGA